MEAAAANQDEEGTIMKPATVIKPLHKIISEHKDVLKIVIQLNSIISTFKSDIQEVLDLFSQYGHLWEKVNPNVVFSDTSSMCAQDYQQTKVVMQLNTVISTFKSDIQEVRIFKSDIQEVHTFKSDIQEVPGQFICDFSNLTDFVTNHDVLKKK